MKRVVIVNIFIGFILGVIFTGIFLNISAEKLLIKEVLSPYDFDKTVSIIKKRIEEKQGWHIVAIYDQNKEIIKNGGRPIGKLKIIHYCNAKFASEMLKDDNRKKMGIFTPKSIIVYEKDDGRVYIAMANGAFFGKLFKNKARDIIEKVSLEVEDIMRFINFKFTLF